MSIWNKVLLGLIFVASVGLLYMGARTLKTHQYWRELSYQHEDQIAKREELRRVMTEGGTLRIEGLRGTVVVPDGATEPVRIKGSLAVLKQIKKTMETEPPNVLGKRQPRATGAIRDHVLTFPCSVVISVPSGEEIELEGEVKSLAQLDQELDKIQVGRGRVWFDCTPKLQNMDPTTGKGIEVTLSVTPLPEPAEGGAGNASGSQQSGLLGKQNQVYVFEQLATQRKGLYLGEFRVVDVKQATLTVTLEPIYPLIPRQIQNLLRSKSKDKVKWTIYELMPKDCRDVYAGLSEAVLKELLPPSSLSEYLKDGQPAEEDDPKQLRSEDGKTYARKLRDYRVAFTMYRQKRTELKDLIDSQTRDTKDMQDAEADLKVQKKFREAQKARLEEKQAGLQEERDALAAHHAVLAARAASIESHCVQLIQANKKAADAIARIQMEATRRIDQRTRSTAQLGGGGR